MLTFDATKSSGITPVLANAVLFGVLGGAAGALELGKLAFPSQTGDDHTVQLRNDAQPAVGEMVQLNNVRFKVEAFPIGGRGRTPIGTSTLVLTFEDQNGRTISASLKTVNGATQAPPKPAEFPEFQEGFTVRLSRVNPHTGLWTIAKADK